MGEKSTHVFIALLWVVLFTIGLSCLMILNDYGCEQKPVVIVEQVKLEPIKQKPIKCKPTIYYDVPLTIELQDYTKEVADKYNVPINLLFGMMEVESGFDVSSISNTDDYGIMQINICNHKYLKKTLGFKDIMDAKNNILSGGYLIGTLYNKYGQDPHKALMAYNMGETGAKRFWNKGIYKSEYSTKVVTASAAYAGTK